MTPMKARLLLLAAVLAAALVAGGCATNPVTGKSDVVMMSAAQEVETHRLKITREPCHKQSLPRVMRINLHRRPLRPAEAKRIAKRRERKRKRSHITLLGRRQRRKANSAIQLRQFNQPIGNFAWRAIFRQPRAKAFGLQTHIIW